MIADHPYSKGDPLQVIHFGLVVKFADLLRLVVGGLLFVACVLEDRLRQRKSCLGIFVPELRLVPLLHGLVKGRAELERLGSRQRIIAVIEDPVPSEPATSVRETFGSIYERCELSTDVVIECLYIIYF